MNLFIRAYYTLYLKCSLAPRDLWYQVNCSQNEVDGIRRLNSSSNLLFTSHQKWPKWREVTHLSVFLYHKYP